MITDQFTSLYRADLLECQQDTLKLQADFYGLMLKHEELSPARAVILSNVQELGEIIRNYDVLLSEPMPESQRNYWEVMQHFYET